MVEALHRYVVDLLSSLPASHELRVLQLSDRIVSAQVDATVVSAGSLSPIAVRLLDCIGRARRARLSDLAAAFGGGFEVANLVGELVHVLSRAGYIEVGDVNKGGLVALAPHYTAPELGVQLVIHPVQFVPTSGRIERRFEAAPAALADIPSLSPEWPELYARSAVKAAIAEAYARNFQRFHRQSEIPRSYQTLQQSGMLRTQPYPAAVTVTPIRRGNLRKSHLCYLYQKTIGSGGEWGVLVRDPHRARLVETYSRRVLERFQDSAVRNNLLDVAISVRR